MIKSYLKNSRFETVCDLAYKINFFPNSSVLPQIGFMERHQPPFICQCWLAHQALVKNTTQLTWFPLTEKCLANGKSEEFLLRQT